MHCQVFQNACANTEKAKFTCCHRVACIDVSFLFMSVFICRGKMFHVARIAPVAALVTIVHETISSEWRLS